MAATLRCQASAAINAGQTKKSANSTLGVPLQQPLGFARPQTAIFAASGALAYGSNLLQSTVQSTVQRLPKKLEKADTEELLGSFLGKREKSDNHRPVFRSALEQVSYETNLSQAARKPVARQSRQTMAGKIAGLLRK